jgi:hypothetical protein
MDRNKIKILLITIALLLIGVVVGTLYSVTRNIKTSQPITKNPVDNGQNETTQDKIVTPEEPGQSLPTLPSGITAEMEAKAQAALQSLPTPPSEITAEMEAKAQAALQSLPAPPSEITPEMEAKAQAALQSLPAPQ